MKKIKLSQAAVNRTVDALDEVEMAVFGKKSQGVRTDIRAGNFGCKPGQCPIPMYGIPPLEELL